MVLGENRAGTLQIPLMENFTSQREAREAMRWLSQNAPFRMPLAEDDRDQESS
ncbi:hypothetical protein RZS08_00330 [Arthrospira platensis SPKY1]|nr:hypothetical protein [Arthrospira platensis SPKY1]